MPIAPGSWRIGRRPPDKPPAHEVVYPGGQILAGEDTLSRGDVLPGFAVSISRLFGRRSR